MSPDLREQIRQNMDLKDTEELLEIWRANHRFAWSDTAFAVVEEIIRQRTGAVPDQEEPVLENPGPTDPDDDGLEEWEARLLDNPDQPEFYDTLEVLALKDNINRTAKAVIVVNVILGLWYLPIFQSFLKGAFPDAPNWPSLLWGLVIGALTMGLQAAILYFPLKALAHILRILMEMEFNSRKAG